MVSYRSKVLSKKYKTLQTQPQQQHKMDRAYTSHEISGKDSQNELTLLMKKPFLKKRSGLFRFYKCLPTMVSTHGLNPNGNNMPRNNNDSSSSSNMTNLGFPSPTKNHSRSKNSNKNNNNNSNHGSTTINNGLHHGHHRSTTYNANIAISEMKQVTALHSNNNNNMTSNQNGGVKNNPEVEIFEIFDDPQQQQNNGTEKFNTTTPVVSKYNLQMETNNFEQGDTHHVISNNNSSNNTMSNYHPNNSEEMLIHNEGEHNKTVNVEQQQQRNHSNSDLLKDENENPRSFNQIQAADHPNHKRDNLQELHHHLTQDRVLQINGLRTNHHHRHLDHGRERLTKCDTPESKSNSKNSSNHNTAVENENIKNNYCFEETNGFTQTPDNKNIMNEQSSLKYPTTCISPCTVDEDDSDDVQDNENLSDPPSTSEIDEEHFPMLCNTSGLFHTSNNNNDHHHQLRRRHNNNNSCSTRHQFNPTNQLSEQLHHELQGIKNKVTCLEKNLNSADNNREKTNIINKKNSHNRTGLLSPLFLYSPEDQDLSQHNSINRPKTKLRKQQQQQQQLLEFSNTLNNNDFLIRSSGKTNFKTNFNFQNVIQGIQNGIDRIDMELQDIQSSFNQKMEILEEELHIKSQRWCENQIKMADKVHSLFSELESLKSTVKAQQHQVNNLAENVDKEFETIRSDWKESQARLETRVKVLESHNNQLFDQITCSNQSIVSKTNSTDSNPNNDNENKIKASNDGVVEREQVKNNSECTGSINTPKQQQYPVQVCNQGSQVSPSSPGIQFPSSLINSNNNTPISSTMLIKNQPEDGLDSGGMIGSQIISARKTLLNGDIETVYTNGTREIIKADKSEIRHMYRNGDIRTVSQAGTVTYFYAESSTWQTTYQSGVELFKFPNGVIEKRLPNGIIEQTDIEGRVTFFQQAPVLPTKAISNSIDLSVPPVLKNNDSNNNTEINNTSAISSHKLLGPGNGLKLCPGERMIVFENGENEIHGADYRRRVFSDGTIKTVYNDGSQETRYVTGRVRIKDSNGVLVADVNLNDNAKNTKLVRDFGA